MYVVAQTIGYVVFILVISAVWMGLWYFIGIGFFISYKDIDNWLQRKGSRRERTIFHHQV